MSEESEPIEPEPFPKRVPKPESGNSMEIENIESEASPCPIPEPHVQSFTECCERYKRGELTDLDVVSEVIKNLKELKK